MSNEKLLATAVFGGNVWYTSVGRPLKFRIIFLETAESDFDRTTGEMRRGPRMEACDQNLSVLCLTMSVRFGKRKISCARFTTARWSCVDGNGVCIWPEL